MSDKHSPQEGTAIAAGDSEASVQAAFDVFNRHAEEIETLFNDASSPSGMELSSFKVLVVGAVSGNEVGDSR